MGVPWHVDRDLFLQRLEECGGSVRELSRRYGISSSTASKWARRHLGDQATPPRGRRREPEVERPGTDVDDERGTATVVSEPTENLSDPETLMRDRGLDPDAWEVTRATVNEWDGFAKDDAGGVKIVKLRQLKLFLKRRADLGWLFPAAEVERRWRPRRSSKPKRERLAAILSDQQAPYHDEQLHAAVCRWLSDVKPDDVVIAGDLIDLPTISRHLDRPLWDETPQECLNAGYRLLSDYADAAPTARRRIIRGNHEKRFEDELLRRAERLFGVRPAEVPGAGEQAHALSLRRLLHLDQLGYELVGVEGDDWRFAEVELTPEVVVRHQLPPATKAPRLRRSIVAGDSHRQRLEHLTEWEGDQPVTRTMMQVGLLASVRRDGLGYALEPDWQQGFGTVGVTGGVPTFDLAYWRDGRLTWRGRRW